MAVRIQLLSNWQLLPMANGTGISENVQGHSNLCGVCFTWHHAAMPTCTRFSCRTHLDPSHRIDEEQ